MKQKQRARSLDEELKQLETRWKILNEKVAIQELKNENTAKKETISQLQSKIVLLETRLEKLLTAGALKKDDAVTSENAADQEAMKETNNTSEEEQEKDEDIIRVMAFDNEEEISDNFIEEQNEKQGIF